MDPKPNILVLSFMDGPYVFGLPRLKTRHEVAALDTRTNPVQQAQHKLPLEAPFMEQM